jgi:hypothetical protein
MHISAVAESEGESEGEGESELAAEATSESGEESSTDASGQSTKAKHALTCQTCGKTFEHMNPRLRDCLDCYRSKRKERRRGGDRQHKTVIQHPLAQQATTNKSAAVPMQPLATAPVHSSAVRNYRKAIEETRAVTGNLKRRLERPDLAEGERRWLEQIYAYQLILHQGWRHLAEYKSAGQQQNRSEQPKSEQPKLDQPRLEQPQVAIQATESNPLNN